MRLYNSKLHPGCTNEVVVDIQKLKVTQPTHVHTVLTTEKGNAPIFVSLYRKCQEALVADGYAIRESPSPVPASTVALEPPTLSFSDLGLPGRLSRSCTTH